MATRRVIYAALIAVLLALAGCGQPAEGPSAGEDAPPAPTASATRPAATQPLEGNAPPTTVTEAASEADDLPDVPYQMTGYEIIASQVGTANYSGYTCVLTPAGCACELPAIQEVTFNFRPDGALEYSFTPEGGGSGSLWEMYRAGANEWEYRFSVESDEQGGAIGQGRLLLSFNEAGYSLNQLVEFAGSGIITCPEVNFRRLPSGSGE